MTDNLSQESIITPIEDKRLHRFDDVDEDIFNNIDGIESPKPSSHRSNLLDKYKDHKEHYDFIKILIDKYINSFKNMARIDEGKPPLIDFYDVLGFLRKNNIKEDNTNQLKKDIFTTVTKEVPSQSFHILDQVNEEYYDIILSTVFEEAPELYMEESAISALNNVLGKEKTNEWLKSLDKEALIKIAKKNPESIFNNFTFFFEEEYAREIITTAKREYAKDSDPKSTLTELFMTYDSLFDVYRYIIGNKCTLTLGNQKEFPIDVAQYSIVSGLCTLIDGKKLRTISEKDTKNAISEYEKILNKYIDDYKEEKESAQNTTVFFLWNEDDDGTTLNGQRDGMKRELESRYKKVINYGAKAEIRKQPLENSETIGTIFADQIETFIRDKILSSGNPSFLKTYIGLHGNPEGKAKHGKNSIAMEEFEALRNITSRFTEDEKETFLKEHGRPLSYYISYEMRSCFSGYKFDEENNEIGNISASSSQQPSTTPYTETYLKASQESKDGKYNADFDGDGYTNSAERKIRQMLHYNGSIIKTTYQDKNGKVINIS